MNMITVGNFFMTEEIGELVKACCAAVPEFGDVLRDIENPFFRSTYADLANYIEGTRGPLAKHGVFFFQGLGMTETGPSVTSMLVHTSDQKLGFTFPMPASKPDAQGIGGAVTYDRRFSYGPITNTTGEYDDDGNAAVGSRKEHLAKLDQTMAGQERITHVQAKAFDDTAKKNGRTEAQIRDYLNQLNGYVQSTEITKQHYDSAIKWALNQPKGEDLIGELNASVKQAHLKRLYGIAGNKKISNDDLHRIIKETVGKEHVKELTKENFEYVITYLENIAPAG